jgi:hypothetical protein
MANSKKPLEQRFSIFQQEKNSRSKAMEMLKLLKEKEICTCKYPDPITKVSENGIFTYCQQCSKTYKK